MELKYDLNLNILILSLHIIPRITVILEPSATIRPNFTIQCCTKHCKLVESHSGIILRFTLF